MTTLELKTAIHQAVDKVPENALPDVLNYIKAVQENPPAKKDIRKIIDKIFEEDANLLRRLAE